MPRVFGALTRTSTSLTCCHKFGFQRSSCIAATMRRSLTRRAASLPPVYLEHASSRLKATIILSWKVTRAGTASSTRSWVSQRLAFSDGHILLGKSGGCPVFFVRAEFLYVRFWPKADIPNCTAHVRFWGESGHQGTE